MLGRHGHELGQYTLRAAEGSFAKSRVDLQTSQQVASVEQMSREIIGRRSVRWVVVQNGALGPSSGVRGKCYPVALQVGVVTARMGGRHCPSGDLVYLSVRFGPSTLHCEAGRAAEGYNAWETCGVRPKISWTYRQWQSLP